MVEPTELLGTWHLKREIEDLRNGQKSSADGSCDLARVDADRIRWHERVTLRHAGHELPASRHLRIERGRVAEDALSWHVYFDDGRYFHPWRTDEAVSHPCGADLYEGVIELEDPAGSVESWQITWRVRGPAKDLRIDTRLNRPSLPEPQKPAP